MKKAFGSAAAAFFLFCFISELIDHPPKPVDITPEMVVGGFILTWLLVSVAVFVWRFREWRDSRYVTFIYWR